MTDFGKIATSSLGKKVRWTILYSIRSAFKELLEFECASCWKRTIDLMCQHSGYRKSLMSSDNTKQHTTVYATYDVGNARSARRKRYRGMVLYPWEVWVGDDDCSLVTNRGHSLSLHVISELGFHSLGYLVWINSTLYKVPGVSSWISRISFFLGAS